MPNNLFPVKDSSDSDSVEAAEVKSCMDWSVFTDEDSVNLLREFLKEHADQLPDEEDEGDVQEAQRMLTAGTSGRWFNDRDHKHTKTQWAEWRLGMNTRIPWRRTTDQHPPTALTQSDHDIIADWTMLRELADGAAGGPKELQLIRMKFSTSTTPSAVHLRRMQQVRCALYMQPPAPGSTVEIFNGAPRPACSRDAHTTYTRNHCRLTASTAAAICASSAPIII
jgi:hypothetical protein